VGWENPTGVQFTTVDLGLPGPSPPLLPPCSCRNIPDGAECDVDYARLTWDPTVIFRGWGAPGARYPGRSIPWPKRERPL